MIPVQQARGIFTQAYLEAYKELIPAPSFFKSFFTTKTSTEKYVSIEVQRGSERIASDVIRGTQGDMVTFNKSTEKTFKPPFYKKFFDATSLDRYDRVFGSSETTTASEIGGLAILVAEKYAQIQSTMDRSKELMCAQVLESGIVTTKFGDAIDFKRKATSLVDLEAAGYWNNTSVDVEGQINTACQFLRNVGKNTTGEFNMILSGAAWIILKETAWFKNVAKYDMISLFDIAMPQKSATGGTYVGRITAGAYILNCWVNDEVYENESGVITRYVDESKVIILPVMGTRFTLVHAGIPAIFADMRRSEFPEYIKNVASEYYFNNFIDKNRAAHIFELMTAPLAIPVTVDMIYTMKVLGTVNPEVN